MRIIYYKLVCSLFYLMQLAKIDLYLHQYHTDIKKRTKVRTF
jgi:hypothetical protein